jgi:hypothetical protein
LGDGADQHAFRPADEPPGAFDGVRGRQVRLTERGGRLQVDELEPGRLAQLVEVARDDGQQVRQRRPGVVQREPDADERGAQRPVAARAGQRLGDRRRDLGDAEHDGGVAGA